MLAYDGIVDILARPQCCDDLRCRRRIAKRHRDVPQPASVTAAPDGGTFRALQKFPLAPRKQFRQRRPIEIVARAEVRLVGALGELVPRTHELAVVAAED